MGHALLLKCTPGPPKLCKLSLEMSTTTIADWLCFWRKCNKLHSKPTYALCQSGLGLWRNAFRGKTETFVISPLNSRAGFPFTAERVKWRDPSTHSGHLHTSVTLGLLSDDLSHFSSDSSCWTAATMTHVVSGDEGSYSLRKSPDCSEKQCWGSVQLWVFLSL